MEFDFEYLEGLATSVLQQANGNNTFGQTFNVRPVAFCSKPMEYNWRVGDASRAPARDRDGKATPTDSDSRTFFTVLGREESWDTTRGGDFVNLTTDHKGAYFLGDIPLAIEEFTGHGSGFPYPNHLPHEVKVVTRENKEGYRNVYIGQVKCLASRNITGSGRESSIDDWAEGYHFFSGSRVTWKDFWTFDENGLVAFTGMMLPPVDNKASTATSRRGFPQGFEFYGWRFTIKE